jgi:DNA-binding transcriptional regulator YdaS (Cro superfamily)
MVMFHTAHFVLCAVLGYYTAMAYRWGFSPNAVQDWFTIGLFSIPFDNS